MVIHQKQFSSPLSCKTLLLQSSIKSMSFQILGLWFFVAFGILGTMCSGRPNKSFKADDFAAA